MRPLNRAVPPNFGAEIFSEGRYSATEFRIFLPGVFFGRGGPSEYHAGRAVADQGRASSRHPMRVLIVDDEVNLRFAIERRLRKAGMETGS